MILVHVDGPLQLVPCRLGSILEVLFLPTIHPAVGTHRWIYGKFEEYATDEVFVTSSNTSKFVFLHCSGFIFEKVLRDGCASISFRNLDEVSAQLGQSTVLPQHLLHIVFREILRLQERFTPILHIDNLPPIFENGAQSLGLEGLLVLRLLLALAPLQHSFLLQIFRSILGTIPTGVATFCLVRIQNGSVVIAIRAVRVAYAFVRIPIHTISIRIHSIRFRVLIVVYLWQT
mmetsp:Transcript_29399/g.46924  ORF Transcript_29399/g.46924 Transcript_29399/m.46924 type:complete len:231 (+) Transcript_29399:1605-2297(+)